MSLRPKIIQIDPPSARAGDSVLVDGENFVAFTEKEGGGDIINIGPLDANDDGGTAYSHHIEVTSKTDPEGWRADFGSENQIKLTLGFDIPPGLYQVSITDTIAKQDSDQVSFKVNPWKYKVIFLRFHCIDESNEASGSDEIAVAWAVSADSMVFLKSTLQYEGIDQDGTYDFRPEDSNVLTPDGLFWPVIHGLCIVTHLYEIDSEELTPLHSNGTDSYKIAEALSSSGDETAQAAATGVELTSMLRDALDTGSSPDDLGQQKVFFLASDLSRKTRNPKHTFEDSLSFINPDSEGSHILYYQIVREF
jgi:hypothetical protein